MSTSDRMDPIDIETMYGNLSKMEKDNVIRFVREGQKVDFEWEKVTEGLNDGQHVQLLKIAADMVKTLGRK